jgi:hypothetical protein
MLRETTTALPPGKESPLRYPSDRRLDGPRHRPGRCGKEKNLALSGLELRPLDHPCHSQAQYRLRYLLCYVTDSIDCKTTWQSCEIFI